MAGVEGEGDDSDSGSSLLGSVALPEDEGSVKKSDDAELGPVVSERVDDEEAWGESVTSDVKKSSSSFSAAADEAYHLAASNVRDRPVCQCRVM